MSLAVNIVDLAVETAEREKGTRVACIEVLVGTLAGVQIDSLEFCFKAAAKSTIAEDASFLITPENAMGKCKDCDSGFEVVSYYQHCPQCDGISVEISGGKQMTVTAVTIEEEEKDV